MANIPSDLRYAESHEWVDSSKTPWRVGISDHAQTELSDVVFVELPDAGQEVKKGDACAVVESCKAASDVYAPVSGKIVAVNAKLEEEPGLVNQAPYGDGFLFTIEPSDESELDSLMEASTYEDTLS